MNNLTSSFKKFLGNKNTVTIVGVLLIIVILYIGYNFRVNQAVSLREVPVAAQRIDAKTEITSSMIDHVNVPTEFLTGSFYENDENIVGKYTNYNVTLAEGSLFYTDLLVKAEDLPDSLFANTQEGYRIVSLSLNNLRGVYGGPGEYVDIYFSAINDEDKVMFGQFLNGVEILAITDANGNNAYRTGSVAEGEENDAGAATNMLLAVPEDLYLLLGRLDRIEEVESSLNPELVLTPHQVEPDVDNVDIYLTSNDIRKIINDNSQEVDKIQEKMTSTEPDKQETDKKKDNE